MAQSKTGGISGVSEKILKEYALFFEKNNLQELSIEEGGLKLLFKKQTESRSIIMQPSGPAESAPKQVMLQNENKQPAKTDADLFILTSPVTGTFYSSPSPDAPPFVKIGDHVGPDTAVCIVEAMKVFNEIKADVSGIITEICIKNGQPAAGGQALFKIKKT